MWLKKRLPLRSSRWERSIGIIRFVACFLSVGLSIYPATAQTIKWVRQFEGSANAVAIDVSGIYVAGTVLVQIDFRFGVDSYVRKYDRFGNLLWMRQLGSSDLTEARGVALDGTGVYVVGDARGALEGQSSLGNLDAFVTKYSVHGDLLWTRQFGTSQNDNAIAIVAGTAGIYIAGFTDGSLPGQSSSGGRDAFLRKYDSDGIELWTRQFGTTDAAGATSVATDSRALYVSGYARLALPGQPHFGDLDAFVRAYDHSGNELWTRQFGTGKLDQAEGIAVDSTGIYVAGETLGSMAGQTVLGSGDVFVCKYDFDGVPLWTQQFGTVTVDGVGGLAAGGGSIYVGGDTFGTLPGQTSSGGGDLYLRTYDSPGAELWTVQFGTGQPLSGGHGVAVEGVDVYFVGSILGGTLPSQDTSGTGNAFLAKLGPLTRPVINEGGVINHASYAPRPVATGSIAAVYGTNLNDGSIAVSSSYGPDGKLGTTLGGASVKINDISAPMFYSTPLQLGIQIPVELAGQTSAAIQVTVNDQTSTPKTVSLDSFAPGIFTLNQQGTGLAAALHENGVTLVTSQNPAKPNEVVSLFATGLGTLIPPLATGAPSDSNVTSIPASVTIDGLPAEVVHSGTAPALVGLNKIDVRIPANVRAASDVPVVLSIGEKQSNLVTIPIAP